MLLLHTFKNQGKVSGLDQTISQNSRLVQPAFCSIGRRLAKKNLGIWRRICPISPPLYSITNGACGLKIREHDAPYFSKLISFDISGRLVVCLAYLHWRWRLLFWLTPDGCLK